MSNKFYKSSYFISISFLAFLIIFINFFLLAQQENECDKSEKVSMNSLDAEKVIIAMKKLLKKIKKIVHIGFY